MSSLPTCFVLPRHPTSWAELIPIAKDIVADGRLRPIVVIANNGVATTKEEIEQTDLETVNVSDEIEKKLASSMPLLHRRLSKMHKWFSKHDRIANCLPVALIRMRHLNCRLDIERGVFQKLFNEFQPTVILIPGDRELSPVPTMLKVARDNRVPTIIAASSVPYFQGSAFSRSTSCSFRSKLSDLPPLINLLVAPFFPSQSRDTTYGNLMFSSGWSILAHASRDMLSAFPWAQGGGYSNYILQSSLDSAKEYRDLGTPMEKMVVVGDRTTDQLFDAFTASQNIRKELCEKHNLDPALPIVIVAIPPDSENDLCDWGTHLKRLDDYLGKITQYDANVIMSLHPKSRQNSYQELAEKHNFHFSIDRLANILPAGDLFVFSGSTTYQWAKLCGVPSINLDYFHLGMGYFEDPLGTTGVHTPEEFDKKLPEFLAMRQSANFHKFEAQASEHRENFLFDGNAGKRIVEFVTSFSESSFQTTSVCASSTQNSRQGLKVV
jgi:hypothetical protein